MTDRTRCPNCGTELDPHDTACRNCGTTAPHAKTVASGDVPTSSAEQSSDYVERLKNALADKYAITREIGQGGMATVYLADDIKHNRKVAVKVMRPELAASIGTERFVREIQMAAQLNHPHILALHDSGEADGFLYYVMPFVEGESLRDQLNREKQLAIEEAIRLTQEVAAALSYAHSRGVVHRDIKPENILLSHGEAVLADLGIARAVTESGGESLTETGLAIGTPAYMSPEQAGGESVDGRSDIYSLGCVLYEMLAGEPPFTGPSSQAVIARKLSDQIPSLHTVRETVPVSIEAAIEKALAKVPADRFSTADQFAEALTISDSGEPVRSSRRPLYIGIGAVVALIAVWSAFGTGSMGGGGASSELPRLLVLPAHNLGGPEMGYYAYGLSDELSARLTSLSGLEVIGRFSAEQYRDTDKNPQQIGEELNTEYILSLSVRGGGAASSNPVRVSVELLHASSAVQLWSQLYTAQELDDLFDMIGDVASNVAGELGLTPAAAERQALSARPTESQEAWDSYLQGTVALQLRGIDPNNYREAAEHLQRAVTLDPDFVLAWTGLSEAHTEAYWFAGRRSPERIEMAREALDRAAQLDPGSYELRRAKGIYYYHGFLDHDRALEEFDAARNIRPNDGEVHAFAAAVYRRQGNIEGALAGLERAFELDPRAGFIAAALAETYVILGRFSEARSPLRLALALDPTFLNGTIYLAWSFIAEGNLAEAQNVWRAYSEHVPLADLTLMGTLALLTVPLADDDLQDRILTVPLRESEPDTGAFYLSKAVVFLARGETSNARFMADSAAAVYQARVQRVPDAALSHSQLGLAYAIAGRRDPALEHGRRSTALLPMSADYLYGGFVIIRLAFMHLLLGETEVAVPMLRELIDTQLGAFVKAMMQYFPLYAPYREDSAFRALYE